MTNTAASTDTGIFITFEGGEGVGKSTHIRLLAAFLDTQGYQTVCLREPGGTLIGEKIRSLLLDPDNDIAKMTELLLYEAARAQLVTEQINPALKCGQIVLCDRYLDSTFAYQGYGRQMGEEPVRTASQLGSLGVVPDRTLVLIDDLEQALMRARELGADRLEAEGLEFHRRVEQGFLQLARSEPQRVRLIRIDEDKRTTAARVFDAVSDLFPTLVYDCTVITDELLEGSRREFNR